MADDVVWQYGSRDVRIRPIARDVVEVRATTGRWFWRREVRRELRVVRVSGDVVAPLEAFWVDTGVQLCLAPRWLWASVEHALSLWRMREPKS